MGRKSLHTEEFKSEAIELANREGLNKAAKDLGVNPATLRRWKSEKLNPKPAGEVDLHRENEKLRKENEYLRKINEVLKKSTAIFSQDHHPNFK
jgi:transposase-like protein